MKNIITLALSLFNLTIFAQVGINNNTPKATLDITAQTTNGSKPEGLLPPRLTGDQIQAGDAQYTAAQAGIIIYATAAATAPSTKTANITAAGYYFYDGTAWQKLTSGAAVADATTAAKGIVQLAGDLSGTAVSPAITANAVTSAKILDGTVANADLTAGTGGIYKGSGSLSGNTTVTQGANTLAFTSTATNGFSVDGTTLSVDAANNSVGIGTTTPDTSAALDISSSNKGLLPPRVALSSRNVWGLAGSPAAGMQVYNTASSSVGANSVTANYLYIWDGSSWNKLAKDEVDNTSGFQSSKIQFPNAYDATKTVINGPFEFRIVDVSGGLSYQARLNETPSSNVICYGSNVSVWGGVGSSTPSAGNFTMTFTTSNWNTWQEIQRVVTPKNGHNLMLSIDTSGLPNWSSTPLFYNFIAQFIGNTTTGLKTLIINRY